MNPIESGRKGGLATRDGHLSLCPVCGRPVKSDFYKDTGRAGGEATLRKHGREFYTNIGKMGGRPRTCPKLENKQLKGGDTTCMGKESSQLEGNKNRERASSSLGAFSQGVEIE